MTTRQLCGDVLLTLGIALQLFAVVGVVVMRDVFDRLHYAAAATTFGPFLVVAALIVAGTPAEVAAKGVLVSLVLVAGNPVITHATARAARIRALTTPAAGALDAAEGAA